MGLGELYLRTCLWWQTCVAGAYRVVLPSWAQASWNNFLVVMLVVTDGLHVWRGPWAHTINVVLVGALIFPLKVTYAIVGTGWLSWLLLSIQHHYHGTAAPVSPVNRLSLRGSLLAVPNVLFDFWGILYLAGQSIRAFNRVMFAVWALYLVVGIVFSLCRGISTWHRARQVELTEVT